jgi:hypothetical protein
MSNDYLPEDPYRAGLEQLRAASAQPTDRASVAALKTAAAADALSTFVRNFAEQQAADLTRLPAGTAIIRAAAAERGITVDELRALAEAEAAAEAEPLPPPPNGYQIAVDAMKGQR